jgi:3-deoxy-manno-octulosonate cytidylyltransferase (CMP-KDO synthetase)
MAKILGVIPARFGSTRFQGKPLIDLDGKPMIQRVWEQVNKSRLIKRVIVATDDQRILKVVMAFGGEAVLTSKKCPSGTDRIAQTLEKIKGPHPEIVVNIQGDEPLIPPAMIDQVATILIKNPKERMATLYRPLKDEAEWKNPALAKVVTDLKGRALLFSRAALPHPRDSRDGFLKVKTAGVHVGIYAYRTDFLKKLATLKPTPLEIQECLEQLRVLENGFEIKTGFTRLQSLAVDTPADAARVRKILKL